MVGRQKHFFGLLLFFEKCVPCIFYVDWELERQKNTFCSSKNVSG